MDNEQFLEDAENRGIKKGIQQVRSEAKLETAKKMLEEKASIEFIIKVTGLNKEEIEELK